MEKNGGKINRSKMDIGEYGFVGINKLAMSGRMGHTVRILPKHDDLDNQLKLGLVLWAK